jgi:hypothetical protein
MVFKKESQDSIFPFESVRVSVHQRCCFLSVKNCGIVPISLTRTPLWGAKEKHNNNEKLEVMSFWPGPI